MFIIMFMFMFMYMVMVMFSRSESLVSVEVWNMKNCTQWRAKRMEEDVSKARQEG